MYVRAATPAGLGAFPLIPLAVGAVVGGLSIGSLWARITGQQEEEYELWKAQVQEPTPPPAPAAPETRQELLDWNIQLRQQREREQWERWRVTAIPALPPYNGDGNGGDTPWLLYGALGLASFALVMGLRR